jgi:hypothetical protein
MTGAPQNLTVLRARGRRLAKRLHPDGRCEGYDSARTMDAFTIPVPDLAAILVLLRRLLLRPDCCVIRGALQAGETATCIRRLLHPDKASGDVATIHDVPRRWLALDIEGVPLPPAVPPSDLGRCAAAALAQLPPELGRASCIVQASASHGLKPDLRLRLWLYLDRPVWGHELKRWMRGCPADPSVFGAVQPIYTAAPVLMPGMVDPLPSRVLMLPGCPMVSVPPPEILAPLPRSPVAPRRGFVTPAGASAYVRNALARAANYISTKQHPGRHPAIVAETARLARFVSAGLLTGGVVAEVVRQAARQAGKDDAAEVEAAIAWGLANPWNDGPLPEGAPHG